MSPSINKTMLELKTASHHNRAGKNAMGLTAPLPAG